MRIAIRYIKYILILPCFILGGCSQTPKTTTEDRIVHFFPEAPKEEIQSRSFVDQIRDPHFCYFTPPKGWDLADMSKLSHRMRICFIGKSSSNLLPSVSLATEKVDISLKAYVDIVKSDCEKDPNRVWRDLGKYNTSLGEGRLTEREMKTQWGISRQIQLIVIKDNQAYVLTAGALKEEFSRHYQDFEAVLRSLTITQDLTAPLASTEKKELLQKLVEKLEKSFQAEETFESKTFQKESWEPFQQKIINDFTEMGPYWQILLLRDVQNKLLKRI